MSNEPSFEERQALGNLIKVLESKILFYYQRKKS